MRRRDPSDPSADTEINLVPIMNLFMVLIPFLMMSAAFYHLKAINTSVPVQADRSAAKGKRDAKVTVVVELQAKGIRLSGISESLGESELRRLECVLDKTPDGVYPFPLLTERLLAIKREYASSDTILVIPEGTTIYDTIIRTMDAARRTDEGLLFPNVVLSGKVS